MTTPPSVSNLFLLDKGGLTTTEAEAVLDGAGFGRSDWLVVDVSGPGVVPCLQGLLTNDLERSGEGAFVYGAVLTPKGMILSDLWALRRGGAVLLTVPPDGKALLDDVLRRTLPPRLARAVDRPEIGVWRLVGPKALEVAARAGLLVPEEGRSGPTLVAGSVMLVARSRVAGPYALELHVEQQHATALAELLTRAGAQQVGAGGLELARILSGWPRLGAEIDQKTLPQEVRFDEIDGVSYTKGCYTGQETVARVHFRGHVNRVLAGITWGGIPDFAASLAVAQEGQEIGWVTSAAWVPPIEQFVGLAKVRREVERSRPTSACGAPARVTSLPFDWVK